MTVAVGNIYNTSSGNMFQVSEIENNIVTLINIRSGVHSTSYISVITKNFILIGKPYKEIDRAK